MALTKHNQTAASAPEVKMGSSRKSLTLLILSSDGHLGFTHVTACRIAQPPNGGLCHAASTCPVTQTGRASATRSYRQLPGWILPPLVNRAVGAHWDIEVLHRADQPLGYLRH